ncbi:hypothetical protein CPI04_08970 [Moraxella catarrhalis]|nr:hypothetical protein [Moraxella catarrhalis]
MYYKIHINHQFLTSHTIKLLLIVGMAGGAKKFQITTQRTPRPLSCIKKISFGGKNLRFFPPFLNIFGKTFQNGKIGNIWLLLAG